MDRAVCIGNAKEFRFHSELEIYEGNRLSIGIHENDVYFLWYLYFYIIRIDLLSGSYLGIPDLIRKMLQPNPSDRPTIEDIYQTIQSAWE